MEKKSKYAAQAAYNRRTYVRLSLDLKPEVLERYRAKCIERGTKPTTEIKKFIDRYCNDEEVED